MRNIKRAFCALMALCLLAGVLPVRAAAQDQAETAYQAAAQYLCSQVDTPQPGSVGGEWLVLGLLRGGYSVPDGYYDGYVKALDGYVAENGGVLSTRKYTEYSRAALALTALGQDPSDVGGYNLLIPLGDYDKTVRQGISGPVWALIALDSGGYEMPVNGEAGTQATRDLYLANILNRQLEDGGFALSGTQADPDTTAMALIALSNYRNREEVNAAAEKAISCLSALQQDDGGYLSWDVPCAESASQVLLALCALGIGADDARFVKSGHTLLDNLLSFQRPDGGFAHDADSQGVDQMATEQALLALAAVHRQSLGLSALYDLTSPARAGRLSADPGGGETRCSLIFYYRKNKPVWVITP